MALLPSPPAGCWPASRPAKQLAAVGAAVLVVVALVVTNLQDDSGMPLQRALLLQPSTKSPDGSAPTGAAQGAANPVATIASDALKLWGAWDGLSPVTTQMMAQTPTTRAPARPQAPERGRIKDRTINRNMITDAAPSDALDRTHSKVLHRIGDVHKKSSHKSSPETFSTKKFDAAYALQKLPRIEEPSVEVGDRTEKRNMPEESSPGTREDGDNGMEDAYMAYPADRAAAREKSRVNVQGLKGSFKTGEVDDRHVHAGVSIKPGAPMSGILSGWDKLGLDDRKRTSLQRLSVSKERLKQRDTALETVAELTKKLERLKQRDAAHEFQNTNPADAYNNERDDATAFEKAGINVNQLYDGRGKHSTMGFMTGEGDDRRVLVHVPIKHSTQTTVPAREAPISHDSSAMPVTDPALKSQLPSPRHKTIDLIIEKAAESALKANEDRKKAEAVADELKSKVAELTKKLQSVEEVANRDEARLKSSPETEAEEDKSWFTRVEEHQLKDTGRKWAAIREEEKMAREAELQASEQRARRIPIGANEPEPSEVYSLAIPAGQEAYSEKHSSVKAVGNKFPVLSVSRDGAQIRVAAPNDGSFAVGPAKLEIETADGGEALFPYQQVSTVAELSEHTPVVASGLLFTAPPGGQYPLNAAYVMAVADPAHFPIAWRDANGLAVKIIAPNDGTFRPGPGAVLVKRVGGEEDVYAYKSLQFEKASQQTGPAGLLLTAANATVFPREGAFAGPGDASMLHLKDNAFSILWRSSDGSEIKVQAPNDGSFNLGPSRFYIRLKGGGIAEYPYDSVTLAPSDDHGPAGLLFKAPPEVAYPEKSQSVEADGFPEPYPVFGRSSDGQTVYIQAPNDGTFEPGPSSLRLRLANAQSFTFPYAFIAWYPPKGGLPGGLAVTAPEGVHYPESSAYAGPIDGLKRHRAAEPRFDNEQWPQKPKGSAAPVKIEVVEAMSQNAYSAATLCKNKAAYGDRRDLVFREVPDALLGQTFVLGADSDVKATGANFLAMQLKQPSDLFLLWDERGVAKRGGRLPAWVDSGFVDTGSVVWLSGGPMVVLRSRMPVSGPIYLGGCRAFPGAGAVNNYILVVAAAGALSGDSSRGNAPSRHTSIDTWVKKPAQNDALDLQVLLYKDSRNLIVRSRGNPFPKGRGYLRITAVDFAPEAGPATQAQVGQLVAYGQVSEIDPGSIGYPGIVITAMGRNQFPAGIRSVEPTVFRVLAVRAGGMQLELDAPQGDWFAAGPATLSLVLKDGSLASIVYESVGALASKGGLIFTALEGEAFPESATWATPGGPAAGPAEPGNKNPALSQFPRKDVEVRAMYAVAWLSSKRDELRVECPTAAFEPGPARMIVRTKDNRGVLQEGMQFEYSRAAPVVADAEGGAGMLLSAARSKLFPERAAMVTPLSFKVGAVRHDGRQMQVLTTLDSFPQGPASVRLVRADGRASAFPYQSVVQLTGNTGVLLTAPSGFLYPENADYVEKIATIKKDPLLAAHAEDGGMPLEARHLGSTAWLDKHATGALVVTDAHATTGSKVVVSVAVPGASLYTDRVAAFTHVPTVLYGMPLISLADGDGDSHAADTVHLRASEPSHVYILRDPRGTPAGGGQVPLWLTTAFVETADKAHTSIADMPYMSIYRSKVAMFGPIRLGGNSAFPSRGAMHNYLVVLRPAHQEPAFQEDVGGGAAAAVADNAAAAPLEDAAAPSAGAQAREEGSAGMLTRDVKQAIDERTLKDIVRQCDSKQAAKACLEHMHTCMAPYKMGDISSCHCFTTSWAAGKLPGANNWAEAGWCSDRCRIAVYQAYEDKVVAATGFRMGCGLDK